MSYALDTSKRKFHRILDSISNNSNTSLGLATKRSHNGSTTTLSSEQSAEQPPVKRSRHSRPQSEALSSSNYTTMDPVYSRRGTTVTNLTRSGSKPAFMPWDRGQFLERLKTFSGSVVNWATKPDIINEVEWAKQGWSCVGKEMVGCSACAKRIVISLKKEQPALEGGEPALSLIDQHVWQQNARKELAERYASLIISGHYDNCLWRTRACDASIQRLPLVHRTTAIDSLQFRYEALLKIHESLPSTTTFPEGTDLDTLFKRFIAITSRSKSRNVSDTQATSSGDTSGETFESNSISHELKLRAFGYALFGWNGHHDSELGGNKIAGCGACFRRLGLWLWLPRPRPDGTILEPCKAKMEVANEHRHYCPWINATTQSAGRTSESGGMALCGWETLVRAILSTNEVLEEPSLPNQQDDDQLSTTVDKDGVSKVTSVPGDKESLEAKDKDRWAKLKKLKKAFHVKKVKKLGTEDRSRPNTAA